MDSSRQKRLLIDTDLAPLIMASGGGEAMFSLPRREFLRATAAGAGGLWIFGHGVKHVEAGIPVVLGWMFKAAVEALVGAAIGFAFTKLVEKATVQKAIEPKPDADIHSRFSAEYTLKGIAIPTTKVQTANFWMQVGDFVRSDSQYDIRSYKDLNYAEICRIGHAGEIANHGLTHPCGYRTEPQDEDRDAFEATCRLYRTDPRKLNLEYVRPITNTRDQLRGFGVSAVRDPTRKDLLIGI